MMEQLLCIHKDRSRTYRVTYVGIVIIVEMVIVCSYLNAQLFTILTIVPSQVGATSVERKRVGGRLPHAPVWIEGFVGRMLWVDIGIHTPAVGASLE